MKTEKLSEVKSETKSETNNRTTHKINNKLFMIIGVLICAIGLHGCGDASVERGDRSGLDQDAEVEASEIDDEEINDEEIKDEEIKDEEIKDEVSSLPAGYARSDSYTVSRIGEFNTITIYGDSIDESIFAEKEYTLVNVWGTFCGPCIREMPELQKLSEDMPGNMQMIGIVCDVYADEPDTASAAVDIVSDTGVTYTNLTYCAEFNDYLYNVEYIPTTFVVDSEGYVLAEVIVGADVESYKKIISDLGK